MVKWTILIAMVGLIGACSQDRPPVVQSSHMPSRASSATPVTGPSWLKHLGIAMSVSRMGQMGGRGTAPAAARREPELGGRSVDEALSEPFELTGADLYRVACRSCHGPDGKGAPPEINSLIGPVQGTSSVLIRQRMEIRGAAISEEMAAQMASEAEKSIRDRLRNGGKNMPAFAYLRPDEVSALLSYLKQLADVPGEPRTVMASESAARVGEMVIKGTCHICHDATGPGGRRMMMMMRGVVPSLASLPDDHSLGSVVDQVEYGSSGMMMMGDRMPPLPYLTRDEIAAAYLYLLAYPPQKNDDLSP